MAAPEAKREAAWQAEREAIQALRDTKERVEHTRIQIEQAERRADLEEAARLRYGTLRELEAQRSQQEERLRQLQAQSSLLKEEVDAEDVAGIVSKWTCNNKRYEDEVMNEIIGWVYKI